MKGIRPRSLRVTADPSPLLTGSIDGIDWCDPAVPDPPA